MAISSRKRAWILLFGVLTHQLIVTALLGFALWATATGDASDAVVVSVTAVAAALAFLVAPILVSLGYGSIPRFTGRETSLVMLAETFWGSRGPMQAALIVGLDHRWLILRRVFAAISVVLLIVLILWFAEPRF